MRQFFRNLPKLSYEGRFLWKVALGVIALGIGVGFLFHQFGRNTPSSILEQMMEDLDPAPETMPTPKDNDPQHIIQSLRQAHSSSYKKDPVSWHFDEWGQALERGAPIQSIREDVEDSSINDEQKRIARLMVDSIEQENEPTPELVALAEEMPPVPYSNFALGLYWRSRDYTHHAARAFEREDAAHDNELARDYAVNFYLSSEAINDLARLVDDPAYEEQLEPHLNDILYQKAVSDGDWPEILKQTLIYQYTNFSWQHMLIALLTGAAWFAFLLHSGRLWRAPGDIALCGAAFVLGALSTTATLMMIVLQEEFWGFEEKYDLIGGFLYCIAGIGLREEFLKLLFFAPLIPFLLRRKDAMLALIVAGCVGLGFAAEENVSYFSAMGLSGPGRFLTANFLHISATALTGYALYRAFVTGWKGADYAASVFGMVVFAHGLYDAFLMLPALHDYSIFAFSIYVLLCYQMFSVMDQVRSHNQQKISLSFVFTLSLSIVLAVCTGWAVSMVGFEGLRLIGGQFLGVAAIVIMFFRVINEPIRT